MLGKNEWVDMREFQTEMGLDEPIVLELYGIFVDELEEQAGKLRASFEDADYPLSGRVVHNIKGITASYKAEAALLQAVHIDLLCKGEQWSTVEQKLSGFLHVLNQTIDGVRDLLGRKGENG